MGSTFSSAQEKFMDLADKKLSDWDAECLSCSEFADHCPHWCSECFQKTSPCQFCIDATPEKKTASEEKKTASEEKKISPENKIQTVYIDTDETKNGVIGNARATCPSCNRTYHLYFKLKKNGDRHLCDDQGRKTCSVMVCNCNRGSATLTELQAELMELAIRDFCTKKKILGNPQDIRASFGKSSSHIPYQSGDQIPQHLTETDTGRYLGRTIGLNATQFNMMFR